MVEAVKLVIVSFFASVGFGIVFRIERKYLVYAGLGGALTRLVYLILLQLIPESFIYSFLAAMAAALFAECMAIYTKNPSTVFLYPSIIPLIPGTPLYYTVVGLVLQDTERIRANAVTCVHSLLGVGIGFVVVSMVMYYERHYRALHWKKLREGNMPHNDKVVQK
ncbi:MAG: threonine/serine exporter family protein [Lachnospiraceae bacterium]|nr:threonine/serine exporter family protein [Lachnospiraceae bacterium]